MNCLLEPHRNSYAFYLNRVLFTLLPSAAFDHLSSSGGNSDGIWHDAFGVKGLGLGELAIEIGASLVTTPLPVPELALSGKLQVRLLFCTFAFIPRVRPFFLLSCS